MHLCFWEDIYIRKLWREIFLNKGTYLNMLNQGYGSQKVSNFPLKTKYFDRDKWLFYGWVLNSEKREWERCKINAIATLTILNLADKSYGSQWPLWLNSQIIFNVPTFSFFIPTKHNKKYTGTKIIKFDLKVTLRW